MIDYSLTAKARDDLGKGASRRLRRLSDEVPAVVYGGKDPAQPITLEGREIKHALENEAFYSHIINLKVDGGGQDVILKDVQRHPFKPLILHVDFLRVSADQKLTTRVPLHFINEDTCPGVKLQGGVITHNITDIEIQCLPKDLPEYIEVDMGEVNLEDTIHLSDINMPEGVESVELMHGEEHDQPVAAIHIPRAVVEEEDVEEADTDAEAEGDESEAEDSSDDESED
jgi:large subunit ribosomal protein L25